MVVSSRKKDNVEEAVDQLRREGLEVSGVACHGAVLGGPGALQGRARGAAGAAYGALGPRFLCYAAA